MRAITLSLIAPTRAAVMRVAGTAATLKEGGGSVGDDALSVVVCIREEYSRVFFNRKTRMSSAELAETLASHFAKESLQRLESALWEEMLSNSKTTGNAEPRKELVLYWLSGFLHGFRSSTNSDNQYQRLVYHFLLDVGRLFVQAGLFATEEEFKELGRDRTDRYLSTVDANVSAGPESVMRAVGREFTKYLGREHASVGEYIAINSTFSGDAIDSKKMFDELFRKVKLVD